MRKIIIIILAVAALAVGLIYGYSKGIAPSSPTGPSLVADFLDADHGNGVLARTPEGVYVLIDPGPVNTANKLVSYLKSKKVRSLVLIVTNPSANHVGSVQAVATSFKIRRFIHGEQLLHSSAWTQAVAALHNKEVAKTVLWRGKNIRISPSVVMETLSPPKGLIQAENFTTDNNSLVIRLRYKQIIIFLASYIRTEAEGDLIESNLDLSSAIYVPARHGRSGSTSLELISMIKPKHYIILCGKSSSSQPHKSVLARIDTSNTGAEIHTTDVHGNVRVITDGHDVAVRPAADAPN